MAFEPLCTLDDVWEGEMGGFETADGTTVLVVVMPGPVVKAYQGYCPHQQIELAAGELDGELLTCSAHLWQFDVSNGEGVNPSSCHLAAYRCKVENDTIFVDIDGVEPFQAGI